MMCDWCGGTEDVTDTDNGPVCVECRVRARVEET